MSRSDDDRLPHSPGLPNVLHEKKSQMLPHGVLPNEQSCVQHWFKWTVGWGLEITHDNSICYYQMLLACLPE